MVKIVTLMEDTKGYSNCVYEHGLSLYIETKKHKLLIDTGASNKTWENAGYLDIDLTKVDTVILSHGHYDHTGGVMAFANMNPQAKIYMQRTAGDDYYSVKPEGVKYIGIDKEILQLPQLARIEDTHTIDEEISIFSNVTGQRGYSNSNRVLKKRMEDTYVQDTFSHEQYVVITEGNKKVLVSGCAHKGILNIMDHYKKLYKTEPDYVISGFHLTKKESYTEQEMQMIQDIAIELAISHTTFLTGHCTGEPAYKMMKEIMGDKLSYIHSGDIIEW